MFGLRSHGRSICKAALYPAQGTRPCSAGSGGFKGDSPSTRQCSQRGVDSARPTAPPRPALLGLAANAFCSFAHSVRSARLRVSRAWAPGPARGVRGHSGLAAHNAHPCFPESRADRAPSNTGLKRTRTRGCSVRLRLRQDHLSFYLPRAA